MLEDDEKLNYYAESEEDVSKMKKLAQKISELKSIKHSFLKSVNVEMLDPIYSIHIPGDYDEVNYLLDLYDDNSKIGDFAHDKIK